MASRNLDFLSSTDSDSDDEFMRRVTSVFSGRQSAGAKIDTSNTPSLTQSSAEPESSPSNRKKLTPEEIEEKGKRSDFI